MIAAKTLDPFSVHEAAVVTNAAKPRIKTALQRGGRSVPRSFRHIQRGKSLRAIHHTFEDKATKKPPQLLIQTRSISRETKIKTPTRLENKTITISSLLQQTLQNDSLTPSSLETPVAISTSNRQRYTATNNPTSNRMERFRRTNSRNRRGQPFKTMTGFGETKIKPELKPFSKDF